jgi:hydrogenase maturation protein HypF
MSSSATVRFRVYGIVQGVGFRPTVDRHARTAGISGSVCNKGPYVEIFAQGTPEQIKCFEILLNEQPPRRAAILKIDQKPVEEARAFDSFSIIESEKTIHYFAPANLLISDCLPTGSFVKKGDTVLSFDADSYARELRTAEINKQIS